jgi:hypothetical protein
LPHRAVFFFQLAKPAEDFVAHVVIFSRRESGEPNIRADSSNNFKPQK